MQNTSLSSALEKASVQPLILNFQLRPQSLFASVPFQFSPGKAKVESKSCINRYVALITSNFKGLFGPTKAWRHSIYGEKKDNLSNLSTMLGGLIFKSSGQIVRIPGTDMRKGQYPFTLQLRHNLFANEIAAWIIDVDAKPRVWKIQGSIW